MTTDCVGAGKRRRGKLFHVTAQHTPELYTLAPPHQGAHRRRSISEQVHRPDMRPPSAPHGASGEGAQTHGQAHGQGHVQDHAQDPAQSQSHDFINEAVMIIDRAGYIQCADRACEALLGSDAEELAGKPIFDLVRLEAHELRKVIGTLRTQWVWRGKLHARVGSLSRTLDVSLRTVGHGARTRSFCLILRPTWPLAAAHHAAPASSPTTPMQSGAAASPMHANPVAAAAKVARSSRDSGLLSLAGRVAGEIAHDFNNQLAVVLNYSSILLRELPQGSGLREHVTDMQSAAWRASEVAREMLRFGSRRMADSASVDVNQLVRDAHALFEHLLCSSTRVEQRLGDQLWPVHARRAHIEWLLIELALRLRTRLGPLACLRISTSNLPHGLHSVDPRWISICVDAFPAQRGGEDRLLQAWRADAQGAAEEACGAGVRAERALAHVQGRLSIQTLPEAGLRYAICMPAA